MNTFTAIRKGFHQGQNSVYQYFPIFLQCFLPSQRQILLYMPLFNLPPNKPLFLHACSKSLLKTQWEKDKLLVTSNFSSSYSGFFSSSSKLPFVKSLSLEKSFGETIKLKMALIYIKENCFVR